MAEITIEYDDREVAAVLKGTSKAVYPSIDLYPGYSSRGPS